MTVTLEVCDGVVGGKEPETTEGKDVPAEKETGITCASPEESSVICWGSGDVDIYLGIGEVERDMKIALSEGLGWAVQNKGAGV